MQFNTLFHDIFINWKNYNGYTYESLKYQKNIFKIMFLKLKLKTK